MTPEDKSFPELEADFLTLQTRFNQVKRDQQRQMELKTRIAEIEGEGSRDFKGELKQIQAELEMIEVGLESHLFSWSSIKEPFWQAVRFGGLGILIGFAIAWLLKS